MAEKNKLHHSPIADDTPIGETMVASYDDISDAPELLQPTASSDEPIAESSAAPAYVKPRGSFADSVASQTEVNQELLDPSIIGLGDKKSNGPQRL